VTESITRVRAGSTTDRFDNTVPDWSDPDELDIEGCAVAPRDAEEDRTNGRQAVIVGFNIYAPPGADIRPTDRVVARGETHEIDGDPGVWVDPFSQTEKGVEIRTRRVEG
jgi:hypothetical protein